MIGKGRIEKSVPAFSNDIAGIRKAADAELANHPPGFKLFAIHVSPSNNKGGQIRITQDSDKVPLSSAHFYYSRPVRGGWEALEIDYYARDTIGITVSFRDVRNGPQPNPAPVSLPATEDAVRRLQRSFPVQGGYKMDFRMTEGGAARLGREDESGEEYEQNFFVETAPRGKWVWWTDVHGTGDFEFIYIDAVTGAATSHCAKQMGFLGPLVAIPCR